LEFEEGDHVFLKVTPYTAVGRAMKTKKLQSRFIGPYQILRRVGPIAYQLAFPPHLSNLHDVFHVSQLRKYVSDPSHFLETDDIPLKPNISYQLKPMRILDRGEKTLRNKVIPLVKVLWENIYSSKVTWGEGTRYEKHISRVIYVIKVIANFEGKIILRGVEL
jgi:hypothetical protein